MVKGLSVVLCQVTSMDRAIGLYRDVLGLTPGTQSPYWSDFSIPGGGKVGLHPPFVGGSLANGSGWILGLEVDDVVNLRAMLEAAGHVVGGYHDVPGGVVIDFADLDGNPIQAMQAGITTKDVP